MSQEGQGFKAASEWSYESVRVTRNHEEDSFILLLHSWWWDRQREVNGDCHVVEVEICRLPLPFLDKKERIMGVVSYAPPSTYDLQQQNPFVCSTLYIVPPVLPLHSAF